MAKDDKKKKGTKLPLPPGRVTDEQISQALSESGGNISATARALKVGRRTVYNRIQSSQELTDQLTEEREINLDELEETLFRKAKAGDNYLLQFALKTQGRSRGYGDRQQLEIDAKVDSIVGKKNRTAEEDAAHIAAVIGELNKMKEEVVK